MYEEYDEEKRRRLIEIDQEISRLQHAELEEMGRPTEVYTRICGYFRPIDAYNKGKREEYFDRKVFSATNSILKKENVLKEDVIV